MPTGDCGLMAIKRVAQKFEEDRSSWKYSLEQCGGVDLPRFKYPKLFNWRTMGINLGPDWRQWDEFEWHEVPPRVSGVYIFTLGERILYVGSSLDIRERMNGHDLPFGKICNKDFEGDRKAVRVRIRPAPFPCSRTLEEILIIGLRPEINTQQRTTR